MDSRTERKYELNRRGKAYIIHRMEHGNGVSIGTPVFRTCDYEEARRKLYELNGWNYQPKKQRTERL